jgi:ferredoxin--NADP+ reductase
MTTVVSERVLSVRHWNHNLFSFKTTRDPSLRFENGHFVMIGLADGPRSLMRAYSIASANYEDHLEFLSIKVPNGAFTSRLQRIQPGDPILVSRKPTGTLVIRDLKPGKNLHLLATGTGLAPFLSLVRDPDVYERFEKVILIHGVRTVDDLAYREYLTHDLPRHEILGEWVRKQLIYYPTATREPFLNNGRLTELIESGKVFRDLGLMPLNPAHDRAMLCGSPDMLRDMRALLDGLGFEISPHMGVPGDYVLERAFVEK